MRVLIVAVLLFFNVVFAMWMIYGNGQPHHAVVPATDPGIASLPLLSERDPATTTPAGSPSPAGATRAEPSPTRQKVPAANDANGVSERPPVAAHGEPSDRKAEPPLPQQCRAIGIYPDRRAARTAAEGLPAAAGEAKVVETAEIERRYWVYLPPFVSRSAAFEGERELRRKGIDDLQVLAGDEKENAISLGLYRDLAVAERRLRQLRGLGYAPEMDVIERSRPYFWIEVPIPGDEPSRPAWLDQLAGSDLQVEVRTCGDRAP